MRTHLLSWRIGKQIAEQTVQRPAARAVQALHAVAAVVAIVVGGTADVCMGATYTWTGVDSAEYGDKTWFSSGLLLNGNWSAPGATLSTLDSLVFSGVGPSDPDQNGSATITNLTLSGGFVGYTLRSSSLSTLTISGVLSQDSILAQAISNPVAFVTGSATVRTQSGDLTLGVLAGSGNFTKSGPANLNLNTASAYTGVMTVGSGTVTFSSGTFGGSINQTGGSIVFAPGTVVNSPSTLNGLNSVTGTGSIVTFNAPLEFGSSNVTTFDLGASGGAADKYVFNSVIAYGGSMTLNFTNSGSLPIGTTWDVFDSTSGRTGEFAGIGGTGVGPYAGLTWTTAASSANVFDQRYGEGVWLSSWTGSGTSAQRLIFNQATGDITVVPEPSTFVMAGAGIAGWGLLRYRRRRSRAAAAADRGRQGA